MSVIERGLELENASELGEGEFPIIGDVVVGSGGFGHEIDVRAEVGVIVVGLLVGAMRRIGLMVASMVGIWWGEYEAGNSYLGVEPCSWTAAS